MRLAVNFGKGSKADALQDIISILNCFFLGLTLKCRHYSFFLNVGVINNWRLKQLGNTANSLCSEDMRPFV